MPLSVGDKLGRYEVLSLLGHGGSGRSVSLPRFPAERDVAIRVSSAEFTPRREI